LDSITIKRVNFVNLKEVDIYTTPDVAEDILFHRISQCQYAQSDATLTDANWSNIGYAACRNISAITASFIDPKVSIPSVKIDHADAIIKEQYTINIHVNDKEGANLAGATVACVDAASGAIFSEETDANGDIAEKTVTYKTWTGTSATLVTSSPHVFTISKAGYRPLVLEAITVDAPIVWKLELQDYGRAAV